MLVFFSFFKQKTAYERRISDWSSDVCYSDLHGDEDNDCYLVSVEIHGRNALCLYQGRSLHGEVIQSLTCPNITPAAVPRPSTYSERDRSRCPAAQSGNISGVLIVSWTLPLIAKAWTPPFRDILEGRHWNRLKREDKRPQPTATTA